MENSEEKALFLMRISNTHNIESLLKEGEIWMNSVETFRKSENNEQGDIYEGAKEILNGKIISMRPDYQYEKIFCVWHCNNKHLDRRSDKITFLNEKEAMISYDMRRYKDFVDNFDDGKILCITKVGEFNERIKSALYKLGYYGKYWRNEVTYFDVNSSDPISLTAFMKPNKYSHQNELRYLVKDNNPNPLIIKIGNIENIAAIQTLNCSVAIKCDYKRV